MNRKLFLFILLLLIGYSLNSASGEGVDKPEDNRLNLDYSTYFGAELNDRSLDIALDSDNCIYLIGYSNSRNFPTVFSYQSSLAGERDVVISKFSSSGSTLLYSTYLGGGSDDRGEGVAVDSNHCSYLTGGTYSLDFPTRSPYQAGNEGGWDAFIAKLSSSGSSLLYSTYFGGAAVDYAFGMTLDSSHHAYISGYTGSFNFPTYNSYQSIYGGGLDGFVAKFSSSGSYLYYSTYLGGNREDDIYDITLDSDNCAYVTGDTYSFDFPTSNPYQANYAGEQDVMVSKFSFSGSTLLYSTYLGGNYWDCGYGIAVDSGQCAYITGDSFSVDFPTLNPYQASYAGAQDAIVTKFSSSGSTLSYSTYLGGASWDRGFDIVVNSRGCACLTGYTGSSNFPTLNAYQSTVAGAWDVLVGKISSSGSTLLYSTYLGGIGSDVGRGIALDSKRRIYVTGWTSSLNFPTQDSYQPGLAGNYDLFFSLLK